MASHTIIADISATLLKILKNNLIPDIIMKSDAIGLCSPSEKGDYILGIYLYKISECDNLRMNTMIPEGDDVLRYPPKFVDLYYMITPYSSADLKYRMQENHLIAGRVIQVLEDNSVIAVDEFESVGISFTTVSSDEKSGIWNSVGTSSKLSLFYKVGPVKIDSEKTKNISRVVSREFSVIPNDEDK